MAASLAAPEPYRPDLGIRLPPWVFDGEALLRPGVKDFRFGQPVVGQPRDPLPGRVVLLAAPPERLPPGLGDEEAEGAERATVGRHGVVVEEAVDDLPQPWTGIG